jgi:tetratricopeptide (TPR) repeat protein
MEGHVELKSASKESEGLATRTVAAGTPVNGVTGEPVNALARAVVLHMKGDLKGALTALESADHNGAADPEILAARGYLLMDLGEYEAAARSYALLLDHQAGDAEAWFQWGFCLQKLGRSAEALEKFHEASRAGSNWIETPLAIGISHLNLKQYTEAIASFDVCLSRDSKYQPALFTKAVALHLTWNFEAAVKAYEAVLDIDPVSEEALLNMISLGLQQKNFGLIETYSNRLLEIKPDVPQALEGLAVAAFSRGDFKTAETHYKRLTELMPDEVEFWLNLGIASHRQSKYPEAIYAFSRARELRPDSTYVQTYLGFACWQTGDRDGARKCFETALELSPERDDVALHLLSVLDEQGEYAEAEIVCTRFLETKLDQPEIWFRLGYLKLIGDKFAEAADAFDHSVQLRPRWIEAELNLALACLNNKQTEKAEKLLETLQVREPKNAEVTKGLAAIALDRPDHERTLSLHERLIELGAGTAEVYYNSGLLAQKLERNEKAVDFYRKALEQRADFPEALLNLGHLLSAVGREDEARACWAPALELKPDLAAGYFRRR